MTAESSLRDIDLAHLAMAPALPAVLPGAAYVDSASADAVRLHLDNVVPALESLRSQSGRLAAWGVELAQRMLRGQRLLAAGNGGSAAEAQHLTAELVGRFDGERVPFSAISLHAETSAITAIANDYGYDDVFARQVRAHGRSGDLLILLSTSGKSPNLLRAAEAASRLNITTWALTGAGPNPLAAACDEAVMIDALNANAQEGHLIALHAVCRAFDLEVARRHPASTLQQDGRP
ncbi:sugar isomerase (SIS) [Pseudarthrobacter chlorophenolicus A6]|uniref:Sugar isomerase (SIS) n=1 Tax=Pseudarthrobacter chlorophenolicus (strain ATCC 700700 / DSM 12829 / CIP 107037 / JCM 12360 / KCTC 9906 / NCIMB 13794 / A6) TaxID=452863 RepID=B8HB84_PSECP|nr:SIS domain-containing protein [Pseudarthrobacter chlorophenolicus]ACL38569.1 sugar isomerase (SIS) [Pseudarthrobacter chlorophenolicus A6]SDQ46080.1 phosphoheptose isomerase [Pseudarthrobacter chlorophenolicus]